MPYGQPSSRRPWGTAQSPHTADGAVCVPASHTTAPRRRHKPGWYPSISPGGFNFTGAQITLQDNETPNTTGLGVQPQQGIPQQGWEKAEGLGCLDGEGTPPEGTPPRTVHLAIGLSLKCSPPIAHPLFLVQILGVRRGGPRPPPLSIPSSLFRASSLPSSSACSPWDIFCPVVRWGSHFSKR